MEIKLITSIERIPENEKQVIIDFLYENLGQYTDAKADIEKAIDHIFSEKSPEGGFVLLSSDKLKLTGAVVVNRTGMEGYIPENILVYIAVDKNLRGNGIGRRLLQLAIDSANGNIALHVDADNPAQRLYNKIGFKTKYLEMRYIKK
ncbi:MAG: GNAT family N-acetyltransferase [Parabacteroides sp.]|nr:GNAT family N-acetyltransferase [Parabacteroides sp.]